MFDCVFGRTLRFIFFLWAVEVTFELHLYFLYCRLRSQIVFYWRTLILKFFPTILRRFSVIFSDKLRSQVLFFFGLKTSIRICLMLTNFDFYFIWYFGNFDSHVLWWQTSIFILFVILKTSILFCFVMANFDFYFIWYFENFGSCSFFFFW